MESQRGRHCLSDHHFPPNGYGSRADADGGVGVLGGSGRSRSLLHKATGWDEASEGSQKKQAGTKSAWASGHRESMERA